MCGLSNGSCLVRYGETAVLCNVTMSEKPREGIDFFPLSVDFEEKLYSVGRIPGSFMRREGRPQLVRCFLQYNLKIGCAVISNDPGGFCPKARRDDC